MKDAAVFLQHIRDAIARIEAYTVDGRRAFLADRMVQDAVIRNLEVIGEAVRNLPLDLRRNIRRFPGGASRRCEMSSSTSTLALISRLSGALSNGASLP